jgi:hypothetical protein
VIDMFGVSSVGAISIKMPDIGLTGLGRKVEFGLEEIGIGQQKTAQSVREKLRGMGIDLAKTTLYRNY